LKTSARGFGFAKSLSYIHGIEKMVMKKIVISIAIIVTAVTAKVGHSEYQQWKQIKEQRDQVGLEWISYVTKWNKAVMDEQKIHGLAASYGYLNLSCVKEATKLVDDYQVLCNLSRVKMDNYDTKLSQGFWGTIFTTFN